MAESRQRLSFWALVTPLSIIFPSSIHLLQIPFSLQRSKIQLCLCITLSLFIRQLMTSGLILFPGYCELRGNEHEWAAKPIAGYGFFGDKPRSGTNGSYGGAIFICLKTTLISIVMAPVHTVGTGEQTATRILLSFDFLMTDILTRVRPYTWFASYGNIQLSLSWKFRPEELGSSLLEEAMPAARKERSSKVTNYGTLLWTVQATILPFQVRCAHWGHHRTHSSMAVRVLINCFLFRFVAHYCELAKITWCQTIFRYLCVHP